jgi:hypothetical protein
MNSCGKNSHNCATRLMERWNSGLGSTQLRSRSTVSIPDACIVGSDMKTNDIPNTSRRILSPQPASPLLPHYSPATAHLRRPRIVPMTPPARPSAMKPDSNDTAVVFIDPQSDVLSENGLNWPLLRDGVRKKNSERRC